MNINTFKSAHHKNGMDYTVNCTDYESVDANRATIRMDYMSVGANGATIRTDHESVGANGETIRSIFIPKSAKMDVFLRF